MYTMPLPPTVHTDWRHGLPFLILRQIYNIYIIIFSIRTLEYISKNHINGLEFWCDSSWHYLRLTNIIPLIIGGFIFTIHKYLYRLLDFFVTVTSEILYKNYSSNSLKDTNGGVNYLFKNINIQIALWVSSFVYY